jgi:hypothetical protein
MKRIGLGILLLAVASGCGSEAPVGQLEPGLDASEAEPPDASEVEPPDASVEPPDASVEPPDAGPTNHAPQLTAPEDLTLVEDEARDVELSAVDVDGDTLAFALETAPAWATLTGQTIRLAPAVGAAGEHTITVTVSDGELTDSKNFEVTVLPAAPELSGIGQRTDAAPGSPEVAAGVEVDAVPVLVATVANHPSGEKVRLEAEIVPASESFTGNASVQGELATPGELVLAPAPLRVGSWKWRLRAVDETGYASAWQAFADGNAAFVLRTRTLSGSVEIAGGAAFTRTASVSIAIQATQSEGATLTRMRLSTDGTAYTGWEDVARTRGFLFEGANGVKTIHVEVEDSLGNRAVLSDDIVLDRTPPQGAITINGGADYAPAREVTLTVTATDANGIAEVCFGEDGATWTGCGPLAPTAPFTFGGGDGLRTVKARLVDAAGNTTIVEDSVSLDTAAPTASLSINEGAQFTISRAVTLALTADDATSGVDSVRFSNDGANWSAWSPPAATQTWTLSTGDGAKKVHAQVRDRAGHEASVQASNHAGRDRPDADEFLDQPGRGVRQHAEGHGRQRRLRRQRERARGDLHRCRQPADELPAVREGA